MVSLRGRSALRHFFRSAGVFSRRADAELRLAARRVAHAGARMLAVVGGLDLAKPEVLATLLAPLLEVAALTFFRDGDVRVDVRLRLGAGRLVSCAAGGRFSLRLDLVAERERVLEQLVV